MATQTLHAFGWLSLILLLRPICAGAYSHAERAICRNIPGDPGWPSAEAWNELNRTVGGRLIATTPLAAPCHEPGYDAQRCAYLREQWIMPSIQSVVPIPELHSSPPYMAIFAFAAF
jgi:hypothetical protein